MTVERLSVSEIVGGAKLQRYSFFFLAIIWYQNLKEKVFTF